MFYLHYLYRDYSYSHNSNCENFAIYFFFDNANNLSILCHVICLYTIKEILRVWKPTACPQLTQHSINAKSIWGQVLSHAVSHMPHSNKTSLYSLKQVQTAMWRVLLYRNIICWLTLAFEIEATE